MWGGRITRRPIISKVDLDILISTCPQTSKPTDKGCGDKLLFSRSYIKQGSHLMLSLCCTVCLGWRTAYSHFSFEARLHTWKTYTAYLYKNIVKKTPINVYSPFKYLLTTSCQRFIKQHLWIIFTLTLIHNNIVTKHTFPIKII